MTRSALFLAALLAGAPAVAQEIRFDPGPTEACLGGIGTADGRACIGLAAQACSDATPDGYTTVGFSICFGRELDWWDARLNAAYAELMRREGTTDAEMAEIGASGPNRQDALREMQRAWVGFRDAACAYERAQWGSGTGAGPATAQCRMQMTAEQALTLDARLKEKDAQ